MPERCVFYDHSITDSLPPTQMQQLCSRTHAVARSAHTEAEMQGQVCSPAVGPTSHTTVELLQMHSTFFCRFADNHNGTMLVPSRYGFFPPYMAAFNGLTLDHYLAWPLVASFTLDVLALMLQPIQPRKATTSQQVCVPWSISGQS